jgi:ElaB/YqjD/DUF883 family membrane-anchored ribosome-binding protein
MACVPARLTGSDSAPTLSGPQDRPEAVRSHRLSIYFEEFIVLESNLKVVNNDVKTLVKDAQTLFHAAAALTGEKAEEVRNRGMRLLDTALVKAQDAQASAFVAGKEMAVSADVYVKENPWRAIAAAAGVGLLVGVILSRK